MNTPHLITTCALAFTCSLLQAQVGTLDASFGTGGWVGTDVGGGTYDEAKAVMLQPDGKIVVAGTSGFAGTQDFGIVRYLSDGTVDNSFGTAGRTFVSISGGDDVATTLALQADGGILVGGYTYLDTISFALVRLDADGNLDTGFGTGGAALTNLAGNTMFGRGLALLPDGKILFAGGGEGGFSVVRYDSTGVLDPSFGTGGLALAPFNGAGAQANAIAQQDDGMLVLAGYSVTGFTNAFAVARFTADGMLDPAFDGDGMAEGSLPSGCAGTAVAIRTDGKIVVVGSGGGRMVVARFTTTGALDGSFFGGGISAQVFGLATSFGEAVIAQADGRTLAAGYILNTSTDLLLVRLNEDGSHDLSFDTDGMVWTDLAGTMDRAHAMAVQPDGQVVLAGTTDGGPQDWNFLAARYNFDLVTTTPALPPISKDLRLYPIPLAATTYLDHSLEADDVLTIDLLDAHGRLVQRVLNVQYRSAGPHREALQVNADLAPGAYFLRMTGNRTVRVVPVVK